ncbi:hypothetical protein SAMN05216299_1279 [Nitrosospira sp. Nsp14]|nr:hypothetical protein SAMN05216299_1279 [Nitrosospira sp. Nsp14]
MITDARNHAVCPSSSLVHFPILNPAALALGAFSSILKTPNTHTDSLVYFGTVVNTAELDKLVSCCQQSGIVTLHTRQLHP